MKPDVNRLITPHFKLSELACTCCGKFNMTEEMLSFIERVRNNYSRQMHINSGVRCGMHNAKVGGKPNSAHLLGLAIDVSCHDSHLRFLLAKAAFEAGVKGLEIRPTWVHMDIMPRGVGDALFLG